MTLREKMIDRLQRYGYELDDAKKIMLAVTCAAHDPEDCETWRKLSAAYHIIVDINYIPAQPADGLGVGA